MALERSDAFRFRMRRSISSMTVNRESRYEPGTYTLKKSFSTSALVPVTYDESRDYYRPWSRKFYRDLYYPDNDYYWYRYYNVGTRYFSYPGVRRLHPYTFPRYDYSPVNQNPKYRWSVLESVYSGWRRYYDTKYYYPYRWWSFTGNYAPPKTSDYSYKAYHPYSFAHYPYTSAAHPYKFKPAAKRFYYDFMYM
uniref:Uncharacterized protein n=2 Tax=Romanomermis culicivorax TaxID=13658 RepID=A0A915JRC0_ROMCU